MQTVFFCAVEYHSACTLASSSLVCDGHLRAVWLHHSSAGRPVPQHQAPVLQQAPHGGGQQDRCHPLELSPALRHSFAGRDGPGSRCSQQWRCVCVCVCVCVCLTILAGQTDDRPNTVAAKYKRMQSLSLCIDDMAAFSSSMRINAAVG